MTMGVFLYIMLHFASIINTFNLVNGKICYRQISKRSINSDIGYNSFYSFWYYCCDNSEHINGTCVECRTGFLAEREQPCKPCSSNRYGSKCSNTCNCKLFERCHTVMGCIPLTTLRNHRDRSDTTTRVVTPKDEITSELVTLQDIESRVSGMKSCKYTVKNVFLYTVCTGSLTLVMVLVSATLTYYRREKHKRNNTNKGTGRATVIIV